MRFIIKTFQGLEEVLAEEIQSLGGSNIQLLKRSVSCNGDLAFMYRANMCLRTALKVMLPVHRFTARTEQDLYNQVYRFDWSPYLKVHQTFAISNTVYSEYFKHSKYAALKTKDAMVDQFRNKMGRRPSISVERPDIQFDLHGYKDQFTISIDSSGPTLNKRGYRVQGHQAPLNEVLAAGMLRLSEWDHKKPLIDPMCGSGTLLIEAAMAAQQIPAQILRQDFAFKNWDNFKPALWNQVVNEAKAGIRKSPNKMIGGDIDFGAISLAEKSIRKLKLQDTIKVRRIDFQKLTAGVPDGMLIFNPPYGERIGGEVNELYKKIGDLLKNQYQGFDAWIISSNMEAFKHLRLRPSKKIVLFNGPLECKFQKYEMYQGSRKS